MAAYHDWFQGYEKGKEGMRRVSRRRLQATANPWISRKQSMKSAKVFSTLNKVQEIIHRRRRPSFFIAQRIAFRGMGIALGDEMPTTLTALLNDAEFFNSDYRNRWKHWKETLPVLHLVYAFYVHRPPPVPGSRPDLVISSVMHHAQWLPYAVEHAESLVKSELVHVRAFDPAARIRVQPAKKITSKISH